MSALSDLVLQVFDLAVEHVKERLGVSSPEKLVVTREDIERVVIALNLKHASLTLRQVDLLRDLGELQRLAAEARGRENAEYVDTVVIEPDGTEDFHRVFPERKK